MSHKSRIAVIGPGNIATVVVTDNVKSNRPAIVADRKIDKAKHLSGKSDPH